MKVTYIFRTKFKLCLGEIYFKIWNGCSQVWIRKISFTFQIRNKFMKSDIEYCVDRSRCSSVPDMPTCMNPNESKFLACISPVNLFYTRPQKVSFAQNIKIEMILAKLPTAYCKSKMHTTLNHLKGTMSKYDNALLSFFKCGSAKMVSILDITWLQS